MREPYLRTDNRSDYPPLLLFWQLVRKLCWWTTNDRSDDLTSLALFQMVRKLYWLIINVHSNRPALFALFQFVCEPFCWMTTDGPSDHLTSLVSFPGSAWTFLTINDHSDNLTFKLVLLQAVRELFLNDHEWPFWHLASLALFQSVRELGWLTTSDLSDDLVALFSMCVNFVHWPPMSALTISRCLPFSSLCVTLLIDHPWLFWWSDLACPFYRLCVKFLWLFKDLTISCRFPCFRLCVKFVDLLPTTLVLMISRRLLYSRK